MTSKKIWYTTEIHKMPKIIALDFYLVADIRTELVSSITVGHTELENYLQIGSIGTSIKNALTVFFSEEKKGESYPEGKVQKLLRSLWQIRGIERLSKETIVCIQDLIRERFHPSTDESNNVKIAYAISSALEVMVEQKKLLTSLFFLENAILSADRALSSDERVVESETVQQLEEVIEQGTAMLIADVCSLVAQLKN